MTTINIGNTLVKNPNQQEYDEDYHESKHLVTEVIFFIKSPHHALTFQDLLGKKIRLEMIEKRKTRKIDFEIKSQIKNESDYIVKLRLAKHIKSMQSLHQLFNKWKISSKWILSHCLSYSLNISSTNKKFRRLSNFTEPYLDGFIIPNVPKTQVIDWLPAVVQSDDALYPVTPSSWEDDDDVDVDDDDVDHVDNDESDVASGDSTTVGGDKAGDTVGDSTGGEDEEEGVDMLTKDDIDAITSSCSFAFSPSTTEPSKFVLHSSSCKCIKESSSSSASSSYWSSSSSSPCKELISSDPFRPIIESMLMKSSKFSSNSESGSTATGICPIASSYLNTSRAKEDGDKETPDSIGPEGTDDDDDDDTCPEKWMKKIQQEISDDDNQNESTPNNNHHRYKIYRHLYDEYATLFKATHKRFHLKILQELYYIQRQKTLRSLILLRHGTNEENKNAKFLWIEYPKGSSSFTTNMMKNDEDIGELKNFPSFIHAFPIKDISKSVVTRPHNNEINIETHIKLFNGTSKQYNKDFDSTWWTANIKSNQRKRRYQQNNPSDDPNMSNKLIKHC